MSTTSGKYDRVKVGISKETKGRPYGHFFKSILAGSRDEGTPGRMDLQGGGFHLLYLANGVLGIGVLGLIRIGSVGVQKVGSVASEKWKS